MAGRRVVLPAELELQRVAELATAQAEARAIDDQIGSLLATGLSPVDTEVMALTERLRTALRRAAAADNPRQWLKAQTGPDGPG